MQTMSHSSNPAFSDQAMTRAAQDLQPGWAAPGGQRAPGIPTTPPGPTMTMGGVVSASAVLLVLMGLAAVFGWSQVERRAAGLATTLKNALERIPGAQALTPFSPKHSTGIVSFSLAGRRCEAVVAALRGRWRIRCRPTLFNGVRISLAFFNTEEEVNTIAAAVGELSE